MHSQCIYMDCTLQWLWDSERINQIKQQKMDEIFDKRLNMSANFNYKSSLISSLALNIKYRPFRNRIGLHCIAYHRNNTVNSMQLRILWNVLILTGNMHFTMWWSILGICNEFIIASHPEMIALSLISNSFPLSFPFPFPSIMVCFGKFSKTPKNKWILITFVGIFQFICILHWIFTSFSVLRSVCISNGVYFILFYLYGSYFVKYTYTWFIYYIMMYKRIFIYFFYIYIYMVRIIQSHASECSVLLSFPKSIIKMRRIG